MKKLISLVLSLVLLLSMLTAGMTVTAAADGNAEAFQNALYILDYFYANDQNMGGYTDFMQSEMRFLLMDHCDYSANTMTIKADDYRTLFNTYYTMNDELFEEVLTIDQHSSDKYDPETDTYTLICAGGFGGFLPQREYLGYKQNGDVYDVYYADINYSYLSDVMENADEYAESLDWPFEIEYNGVIYENSLDGYVAILGIENSGIKYTVEYAKANYSFDFTSSSYYIYLGEALPEGTSEAEYAEALGNPQYIEYEGIKYQRDDYSGSYYHFTGDDNPVTKPATISDNSEIVKIISYTGYTEKDLPPTFDIFDSTEVFVDLEVKDWSKEGIDYVVSHGYMNGTGNGTTFDQTGTMTRAMIVSVLYRIAGSPAPKGDNPFTDLQADQTWYHDAVIWAYENNIVSGTGATTFSPTGSVTREQMATFISRFAKFMGYDIETENDISSFPDFASVNSWAVDGLAWANENGIITGATGAGGVTILAPQGEATREQVATILMRFCISFN